MMLSCLSVNPIGVERCEVARSYINSRALDTLLLLLGEFERATGKNLSAERGAVKGIDRNLLIDPSLHSASDLTLRFMEEGDAEMAAKCLRWLTSNCAEYRGPLTVGKPAQHLSTWHGLAQMGLRSFESLKSDAWHDSREDEELATDLHVEHLDGAMTILRKVAPAFHAEITALTARITLIDTAEFYGASHRSTFGEIFIATPHGRFAEDPEQYFVEHLVHETSHNLLFALMSADPLISNDLDATFDAPLRSDKRPIYGIYHASFVLARMVGAFRALRDAGRTGAEEALKDFLPRLRKGVQVLQAHADLTSAGEHVLDLIEDVARVG